jgi:hypothetical protein
VEAVITLPATLEEAGTDAAAVTGVGPSPTKNVRSTPMGIFFLL